MEIACEIMCICRGSLENKGTHNLLLDRRWIMKSTLTDEIEPPIADKIKFRLVTHEIERYISVWNPVAAPLGSGVSCKPASHRLRSNRQASTNSHPSNLESLCVWVCTRMDINGWLEQKHRCCRPPKYGFNKREGGHRQAAAISYTKKRWRWCVELISAG